MSIISSPPSLGLLETKLLSTARSTLPSLYRTVAKEPVYVPQPARIYLGKESRQLYIKLSPPPLQ